MIWRRKKEKKEKIIIVNKEKPNETMKHNKFYTKRMLETYVCNCTVCTITMYVYTVYIQYFLYYKS
jgi:hypothetical protein